MSPEQVPKRPRPGAGPKPSRRNHPETISDQGYNAQDESRDHRRALWRRLRATIPSGLDGMNSDSWKREGVPTG
jgi:hypothetical protein